MTAKVILNPYASRWMAQKRLPEAETALRSAGVDYEVIVSKYAGHGIELAFEAAQNGFDPIIAAGGDSTYNEIANGLMKAAGDGTSQTAFGILPMGTANDLAANLGISEDLNEAAKIIAAGNVRLMDVCQVNERYFVNNSAIGMETAISVIQMNMKRVHGVFRYLLATFVGIARNPQWCMELEWDDGSYQGPVTLVSVGNNPRTGGVFYTVPHADPFDGKLSFIYGSAPTRRQVIQLLPRMFKPDEGNITEASAIHEIHTTWLKVHTDPGTPVHSDGEVFDMDIQDLEYRVLPAKLPTLIP
ncbi:diacylglycerol/lipid kinase family protein [Chloroflexota bacterium]